ncbi:MAG: hypothetical protein GEU74_13055, partial [Nitriliruptorales bacterium]|nr:hypothetical protein [Nitriliruptorales bacterium]
MNTLLCHARRSALVVLAFVALILALMPTAGAETCGDTAHPSGKDKCEEAGGSGTQGTPASDPDDDGKGPERSNGGADKAGGPGGVNQEDQDGNNGCGNDQDFEDDNEGLCGGVPTTLQTPPGGDNGNGDNGNGDNGNGDNGDDDDDDDNGDNDD